MTAINIATDIPSQITTLEELAAWACLSLAFINPTIKAVEGVGYEERCAQAGVFYVQAENKYRFLGRISLEMNIAHLAGAQKTWKYAQALSNTSMPNDFISN